MAGPWDPGPRASTGVARALMGKRAAEQLMSHPGAEKELQKFTAYLDEAKWAALRELAGQRFDILAGRCCLAAQAQPVAACRALWKVTSV